MSAGTQADEGRAVIAAGTPVVVAFAVDPGPSPGRFVMDDAVAIAGGSKASVSDDAPVVPAGKSVAREAGSKPTGSAPSRVGTTRGLANARRRNHKVGTLSSASGSTEVGDPPADAGAAPAGGDDFVTIDPLQLRLLTPLFGLPFFGTNASVYVVAVGEFLRLIVSTPAGPPPLGIVAKVNEVLTLHVGLGLDGARVADRLNAGPWSRIENERRIELALPSREAGLTLEHEWVESESHRCSPGDVGLDPLEELDPLSAPLRRFVRIRLDDLHQAMKAHGRVEIEIPWGPDAEGVARTLAGALRMDVFPFVDRASSRLDGFPATPTQIGTRTTVTLRRAPGLTPEQHVVVLGGIELRTGRRGRSWHAGWPIVDEYLSVQPLEAPDRLAEVEVERDASWTLWLRHTPLAAFPRSFNVLPHGGAARLRALPIRGGAQPCKPTLRGEGLPCAPTAHETRLRFAILCFDYLELNERVDISRVRARIVSGTLRGYPLRFLELEVPLREGCTLPERLRAAVERELESFLDECTLIDDRVVVHVTQPSEFERLKVSP